MRHSTTARSKKLQHDRKCASRSNNSPQVSLAMTFDSKDIVSKALEQKDVDTPPPSFTLKGSRVTVRNGSLRLPVDHVLLILEKQVVDFEDLSISGTPQSLAGPPVFLFSKSNQVFFWDTLIQKRFFLIMTIHHFWGDLSIVHLVWKTTTADHALIDTSIYYNRVSQHGQNTGMYRVGTSDFVFKIELFVFRTLWSHKY